MWSQHCRMIVAVLAVAVFFFPGPVRAAAPVPLSEGGVPSLSAVAARVTPAVVNIAVISKVPTAASPLYEDPFFRHFFGLPEAPPEQTRISAGSGVIVDAAKGYVITNHHVIDKADEIIVTLKDRRRVKAQRVGSDAATDIALLRIEVERLDALTFGNSDRLKVGDYVLAVGNPFGLGQTVTSGIVSALGRQGLSAEGYEDFIQTDASINPGNSGGALVDLRGRLVGINSAIIAPTGGNIGIGFAVPSNMARAVMDQLIKYGEVRRGVLGIGIQDVTPDVTAALGLGASEGAVVTHVEPGSAAELAGIRAGDVVVAVNGRAVHGAGSLRNRIGLTPRGNEVKLGILRDGKKFELRARLGGQPKVSPKPAEAAPSPLAGAKLRDVDRDGGAVLIEEVVASSPAFAHGLRRGDRIIALNRHPVRSVDDLQTLLRQRKGIVALTLLRDGRRRLVIVR